MIFTSYTNKGAYYEFVSDDGKYLIPSNSVILVDDESGAIAVKTIGSRCTIGLVVEGEEPPTPQSLCSIIVPNISTYDDTTYDSAFSVSDAKWYMLNNLNEYEEYGVYDIVEDIASATTYEGKLGVVGTTEYQYSGGSWSVVGTYEDASVTYTIDNTSPSPYVGQELATTFKIPYADVIRSSISLSIRDNNGNQLRIELSVGFAGYTYDGSDFYEGTVTNDGEYFYLSLPSEAPQSIVIDYVEYWDSTPIHLIVGSKQASVEYVEKATPSYSIYSTIEEMEAVSCPTARINEYAFVGNDLYRYFANEEWSGVTYNDAKMVAFYENETPLLVYNGSGELTQSETKIRDISPISVYIGDGVTSIGDNAFNDSSYPYNNTITSVTFSDNSQLTSISFSAFYNCSGLTSIDIPSGVTYISGGAFQDCSGLTSINIPSGVTYIGARAFNNTPWWNTYSADTSHHYGNIIYINDIAYKATSSGITSCTFKEGTVSISNIAFQNCNRLRNINIPDSVTSIGYRAFSDCSGLTSCTVGSGVTSISNSAFSDCSSLTSITVEATTPPTLGTNVFYKTNNSLVIYVPSASVDAYKTADNWSSYASRIFAIP